MGKINYTRVVLGGLLAGVVINIFEFVTNGVILAKRWEAAMSALGRRMPESAIPAFVVWGFLVGIGAIWLYAAARPRFGPGPRTAALTGFACWALVCALPNFASAAMQLFPRRLLGIGTLVALVEIIVASIAGAWPYKEGEA